MIILPLNDTPLSELVDNISTTLYNGGVVLIPTETVYGLIALESRIDGIKKLDNIKKRDGEKKYQILINSITMGTDRGAVFSQDAKKLAKQFWPGGLTLVVGTAESETLGLRQPDHALIQAVIDKVKEPLTATSANISSQPPLTNLKAIKTYFGAFAPDLVIDAGEIIGKPSTVIDCSQKKTTVLREGTITSSQVKEIINHD